MKNSSEVAVVSPAGLPPRWRGTLVGATILMCVALTVSGQSALLVSIVGAVSFALQLCEYWGLLPGGGPKGSPPTVSE